MDLPSRPFRLGERLLWLTLAIALTVALLAGNCNMGLVLVALQGRASFDVTVYFALAQIPMYTLPALLKPVYARFRAGRASPR